MLRYQRRLPAGCRILNPLLERITVLQPGPVLSPSSTIEVSHRRPAITMYTCWWLA